MRLGLDTNILVRFLTRDDPAQAALARAVIGAAEQEGRTLHISTLVLVELVWVLRGGEYRYSRSTLADVLEQLLDTPVFEVQDRDLVRRATASYRSGPGDFSDHLIGEIDRRAGCETTLTFDRRLAESAGFEILAGGKPYAGGDSESRVSECPAE